MATAVADKCGHVWRVVHLAPGETMVQACDRCGGVAISFGDSIEVSGIKPEKGLGGYYVFEPTKGES